MTNFSFPSADYSLPQVLSPEDRLIEADGFIASRAVGSLKSDVQGRQAKNRLLAYMINDGFNKKSPEQIKEFCNTELDRINILLNAQGDKLSARDKLYEEYPQADHENLLLLFSNRNTGRFGYQDLNRTAAKYIKVLLSTLETLNYEQLGNHQNDGPRNKAKEALDATSNRWYRLDHWFRDDYTKHVLTRIEPNDILHVELDLKDDTKPAEYRFEMVTWDRDKFVNALKQGQRAFPSADLRRIDFKNPELNTLLNKQDITNIDLTDALVPKSFCHVTNFLQAKGFDLYGQRWKMSNMEVEYLSLQGADLSDKRHDSRYKKNKAKLLNLYNAIRTCEQNTKLKDKYAELMPAYTEFELNTTCPKTAVYYPVLNAFLVQNIALSDAKLCNLDLRHVKWSNQDVSGVDFTGADLDYKQLIRDTMNWQRAKGINLRGQDLIEVSWLTQDVTNVDFTGALLNYANLIQNAQNWQKAKGINLSGQDLSEVYWERVDVTNVDFTGALLNYANLIQNAQNWQKAKGINLSGQDLSEVDWKRVDVTGVDFTGALLNYANLIQNAKNWQNAKGINLCGKDLKEVNFKDIDLTNANLSNAILNRSLRAAHSLSSAKLCYVDLTSINLTNVDLNNVDVTGAQLDFGTLFHARNWRNAKGIDLHGTNLSLLDWNGVDVTDVDFTGAELNYANLIQNAQNWQKAKGINLWCKDLSEVNWQGVDVTGVDFTGALLNYASLIQNAKNWQKAKGINLRGQDLSEVNWQSVDVTGVDFTGAKLNYVNLLHHARNWQYANGIDLRGKDLIGVSWNGINLNGIDLSDAQFNLVALIQYSKNWQYAKGIDLRNKDLLGVNWSGIDLKDIDLNSAILNGTLFGAKNLAFAKLGGANLLSISRDEWIAADVRGVDLTNVQFNINDFTQNKHWQSARGIDVVNITRIDEWFKNHEIISANHFN